MRFSISTAFQPVDELAAIARAADELGYHALSMADHVVDLEELATPYPYTADGSRRWPIEAEWPDPWVLIGALASVTTRLRFFTSVYVTPLRNPFQVAKSVGTAAVLSGGRVSLGVGIGWCREEFDLLGADFTTRGRRTDEGLALMKALWEPGWTEFAGEFHTAPRMQMNPSPGSVPILVGGLSEVAFQRAVQHEGWVGDIYSLADAGRHAARLRELRAETDKADQPFEVITALSDAFLPEHFAEAREAGVTEVWTMPWAYYSGLEASLEDKLDGMRRFAEEVMAPAQA